MPSLYERYVLPRLIGCACGGKPIARQRRKLVPRAEGRVLEIGIGAGHNLAFYEPIARQRRKLVPRAEGRVLEIGIGAGHNLAFYDASRVKEVVGIDPSPELCAMAAQAPRAPGLQATVLEGAGENLPVDSGAFDTIVCTYTMCSVAAVDRVLSEMRRVLKPGGRYLFCEHGLAPDADVARWQKRIDPFWKYVAGNCHLSRPVAATIAANGFAIEDCEAMYMPKAPRFAGWNEWGCARPV
jgi:SAM-dependent methyltransferase